MGAIRILAIVVTCITFVLPGSLFARCCCSRDASVGNRLVPTPAADATPSCRSCCCSKPTTADECSTVQEIGDGNKHCEDCDSDCKCSIQSVDKVAVTSNVRDSVDVSLVDWSIVSFVPASLDGNLRETKPIDWAFDHNRRQALLCVWLK
jgi:hypothetical protein